MKISGKMKDSTPPQYLPNKRLLPFLVGAISCALLIESDYRPVHTPSTPSETSSHIAYSQVNEKAPLSDAEVSERISFVNFEFERNHALVSRYLRHGGAQELYRILHRDDSEKGGYVSIDGANVKFHFIESLDAKVFDKLREAIMNDKPIPDPETTFLVIFNHCKEIEKQDGTMSAVKLTDGYK